MINADKERAEQIGPSIISVVGGILESHERIRNIQIGTCVIKLRAEIQRCDTKIAPVDPPCSVAKNSEVDTSVAVIIADLREVELLAEFLYARRRSRRRVGYRPIPVSACIAAKKIAPPKNNKICLAVEI